MLWWKGGAGLAGCLLYEAASTGRDTVRPLYFRAKSTRTNPVDVGAGYATVRPSVQASGRCSRGLQIHGSERRFVSHYLHEITSGYYSPAVTWPIVAYRRLRSHETAAEGK
jgi:hypothetical protein